MRHLLFATAAAIAAIGGVAVAQSDPAPSAAPEVRSGAYALDKSHAKIVWGISHFGFSTYYGEFTDFDAKLTLDAADPAKSKLSVAVRTASLSTNDPALDTHLKSADFFDVAKHADATYVSREVHRTGPKSAHIVGDLTLLGVTKPVDLVVTFNGAGMNPAKKYVAGFSAEGTIKRSDFGMNKYVPALGDDVKLIISGEFNPVG